MQVPARETVKLIEYLISGILKFYEITRFEQYCSQRLLITTVSKTIGTLL